MTKMHMDQLKALPDADWVLEEDDRAAIAAAVAELERCANLFRMPHFPPPPPPPAGER